MGTNYYNATQDGVTKDPFRNLRPSKKEREKRIDNLAGLRREMINILNELSSIKQDIRSLEDRKALRERIKELKKEMEEFLKNDCDSI